MKYISIVILKFIIFINIANCDSFKEELDKVLTLDSTKNEKKFYLITSLNICVKCNISKINNLFHLIKKSYPESQIIFVIESKNSKDSYYLKKYFYSINFIEDNSIFLTDYANIPFLFVAEKDKKSISFKISDLTAFSKYFVSNFLNNDIYLTHDFHISEEEGIYFSTIEVYHKDQKLLIFDYNNNILLTFDNHGKIISRYSYDDPSRFYIGKKDLIDTVIREGVVFFTKITKALFHNDTLFLLFTNSLYNIRNINNKYAISLRSFLAMFKNDQLLSYRILEEGNYENYYFHNQRHLVDVFLFPNDRTDTTDFIYEIDYSQLGLLNSQRINLKYLNSLFGLSIKNIDNIIFRDIDTSGLFLFLTKNDSVIRIFDINKDEKKYKLSFDGILTYNQEVILQDWVVVNDSLILLLSYRNYIFTQIYSLSKQTFLKEFVCLNVDDEIITTKIISFSSNNICLVNRWKKNRWFKDRIVLIKD